MASRVSALFSSCALCGSGEHMFYVLFLCSVSLSILKQKAKSSPLWNSEKSRRVSRGNQHTYTVPRLNHEETENLNGPLTSKEIETIIKNPTKEKPRTRWLKNPTKEKPRTRWFHQRILSNI
uniref:Uncharacterized protein n=1 Tax=Molossus molossus TaxID=27622 RepID=A0A7J8HIG3_MOLMO|nr:hypothetical protein HJG59_011081 [Molossus molossus]